MAFLNAIKEYFQGRSESWGLDASPEPDRQVIAVFRRPPTWEEVFVECKRVADAYLAVGRVHQARAILYAVSAMQRCKACGYPAPSIEFSNDDVWMKWEPEFLGRIVPSISGEELQKYFPGTVELI